MMKKKVLKDCFVTALAGMYLFVMLFGQLFHTHQDGSASQEVQFDQLEKTLSKGDLSGQDVGCLACHLLHDTHAVPADSYNFFTLDFDGYLTNITEHQFLYLFKLKEVSTLRGPPEGIYL